tara:strand:+ start:7401 stop:8522 length:1122 start_codon:yes stop_codon:yes gene_type:complete
MPRDLSGNYTLPAGNPVVTATTITTTWANPTMADIAVQLNNVITRDGLLGPTAPIAFAVGSAALPSVTFATSLTTGLYLPAVGNLGFTTAGVERGRFSSAGLIVNTPTPRVDIAALSGATGSLRLGQSGVVNWDLQNAATTGVFSITNGTGNALVSESLGALTAIYITSAGNVGIGATPTTNLDVVKAAGDGGLQYRSSTRTVGLGQIAGAASVYWGAGSDLSFFSGSERFRMTSDGRLFGTALHNNAGAVTGTVNQYIASGTYTPTFSNTTNVSASTPFLAQWMRVGNVVTVSGALQITITTGGLAALLGISLPIASAFGTGLECAGTAASSGGGTTASIITDVVNDRASMSYIPSASGLVGYTYTFTYLIV